MESVIAVTLPRLVEAAVARAVIAETILNRDSSASSTVGRIVLQQHQVSAVTRLRSAISQFGGALLCDPVGTGKTFIGLALSRADSRVLVVAPAVLKDMWSSSAKVAGRSIAFCSFESLSRGTVPPGDFDFLIVDEAHHARNPATTRYKLLSRLAARSDLVLLTATPVHNRRADLDSLLSLFLGDRARTLSASDVGRCVIRRSTLAHKIEGIPKPESLVWCRIAESGRIPGMLLALPPPLPPRDGGDGGTLIVHSLIRQWASSDAALIGGVRRRLVRAEALIAALEDGTWPSRSELHSWLSGEDTVQLSFSSMLAPRSGDTVAMLSTIQSHRDALKNILAACRESESDDDRATLIRHIRATSRGRRIVAFSQYADTVNGMFTLLARDGAVAALTGTGARVAGGTISRADAIRRFAPSANGSPNARRAEEITLLLTTDLLSEGVNLQDAGAVVHLDLPWTPAKMDQRLGRITRIGSPYESVVSYALRPPIASSDIVRIESILKRKMREAGIVTAHFPSLISWNTAGADDSAPRITESAREILSKWLDHDVAAKSGEPVMAIVEAAIDGFVAACGDSSHSILVGCSEGEITEDPKLLLALLNECGGESLKITSIDDDSAERLGVWLYSRGATVEMASWPNRSSSIRRTALRRIDRAVHCASPHERARIASLARTARDTLRGILGNHMEQELDRICGESTSDRAVLEKVSVMTPRRRDVFDLEGNPVRVSAMLILRRNDTVVSGNGTLT